MGSPSTAGALRIAVDTGGTFTDIAVARPDGSLFVWKVSSTPAEPDRAVVAGSVEALEQLGRGPAEVERFVHGTTVATNALITRTGGRVGLVTTEGFRDLLEIGHQTRPHLYVPSSRRPRPLAPAELTWEVPQRTAPDGTELAALDEAAVRAVAERILVLPADEAPEVVVVSFVNAYADPTTERRAAELLRESGVHAVTAATEVTGEMREYERTSTAVLNAYVQPKVAGYLQRLEDRLGELAMPAPLLVMQSNGGLISGGTARTQSARTLLSGLAGGVIGAASWARRLGLSKVVSFDIGGTSTDIALIRDGRPEQISAGEIEGFPLRLPTVDVHTIGAGGGSIAWQDSGGSLRVGPHSAGATPGPVCYSRGGAEITVTDAHAVLGRLGTSLLGGALTLDVAAAERRMKELAATLGLGVEETAAGVLRVINATMARGVRAVSVERGVDLRGCVLMAFGGAGPLHAADMLDELGVEAAVVPPHPGIASAVGMLDAPVRGDFSATVPPCDASDATELARVATVLAELAERAAEFLRTEAGLTTDAPAPQLAVDVRYLGQSYELTVPWTAEPAGLRTAFDAAHRERYGFDDPAATLEIVTARVTASTEEAEPEALATTGTGALPEPIDHRQVWLAGAWHETPVYRRVEFPAGTEVEGPLVLEQLDSTVVVGPGQHCRADSAGFLHIRTTTTSEASS